MPTANDLPEVLETTEPERLATGFIFTEGPLWHPDGYWFFRRSSPRSAVAPYTRPAAGTRQDHHRRQRHDLRLARPPDRLRRRRSAPDARGPGRQGRVSCRQLQRRALQPAERCGLSLERVSVFYRSGQAPSLPRARNTAP